MKFAGFDGVIFQGAAKRWVYLYLHDGVAELRDAAHLLGKDTWETEEMLKKEIGEPQVSVSCIGPAGENLVKYACICSDRGHIASSNGVGAVAGSKKIKAIVVHGNAVVPIHDKARFTAAVKDWHEQNKTTMWGMMIPSMGTNAQYCASNEMGFLAIKNLTANSLPGRPPSSMETNCGPTTRGNPIPAMPAGSPIATRSSLSPGPTKVRL